MEKHFYYDNYNGLSEWVCENLRVPLEFRPVFVLLNLLAVAYAVLRLNNYWGGLSILFFYFFNAFFIGQLRKERFDAADKLTTHTPIISKQIEPYDNEGFTSYSYEIYLTHPNNAQIVCVMVDASLYDKLSVGDKVAVDYSPHYTRQCDVYIYT